MNILEDAMKIYGDFFFSDFLNYIHFRIIS